MAAIADLYSHLRYWLVEHPTIQNFQWTPNQTIAASPRFLLTTITLYLTLTFTLHRLLRPRLPRPLLSPLSVLHNLILLLLSLAISLGCSLSSLTQMPTPRWLLCFPPTLPPHGPVFFWAQIFYLSKIYEFLDTLLIILGGRPLSFLHVYHHAVVVAMCYAWLKTSQSLMPIALVTNASVHVVMYGYYLSCSLGWRWQPKWKKAVTNCQIVQFGFSFVASVPFLWMHFAGEGCSGMDGWVFNAVFNASLLALFVNFHSKNYSRKEGGGRKDAVADNAGNKKGEMNN